MQLKEEQMPNSAGIVFFVLRLNSPAHAAQRLQRSTFNHCHGRCTIDAHAFQVFTESLFYPIGTDSLLIALTYPLIALNDASRDR